jgi:hypothetical protein
MDLNHLYKKWVTMWLSRRWQNLHLSIVSGGQKKAAMGNTYFPGVSCDEYTIWDFRIHAIVKAGRSTWS